MLYDDLIIADPDDAKTHGPEEKSFPDFALLRTGDPAPAAAKKYGLIHVAQPGLMSSVFPLCFAAALVSNDPGPDLTLHAFAGVAFNLGLYSKAQPAITYLRERFDIARYTASACVYNTTTVLSAAFAASIPLVHANTDGALYGLYAGALATVFAGVGSVLHRGMTENTLYDATLKERTETRAGNQLAVGGRVLSEGLEIQIVKPRPPTAKELKKAGNPLSERDKVIEASCNCCDHYLVLDEALPVLNAGQDADVYCGACGHTNHLMLEPPSGP